MATALDYSAGVPPADAILAAGHVGVIRYVGTPGRRKNITAAEYAALRLRGVAVALIYEDQIGDSAGGYPGGQVRARAAAADADAIGWPVARPIYFAVDSDQVTEGQFAAALAYLDGAASVLGPDRVGVYGEYDVIERAVPGHAAYGWQTVAWSTGRRSSKARLFQRAGQIVVGGIQCDVNDILATDWGQDTTAIPVGGDVTPEEHEALMWMYRTLANTPDQGAKSLADFRQELVDRLRAQGAQLAALAAAVEAATENSGISKEFITQVVDDAVRQHIEITGTVEITSKDGA